MPESSGSLQASIYTGTLFSNLDKKHSNFVGPLISTHNQLPPATLRISLLLSSIRNIDSPASIRAIFFFVSWSNLGRTDGRSIFCLLTTDVVVLCRQMTVISLLRRNTCSLRSLRNNTSSRHQGLHPMAGNQSRRGHLLLIMISCLPLPTLHQVYVACKYHIGTKLFVDRMQVSVVS